MGETRVASPSALCQPPGLLQQLLYCLWVDLGVVGRPSSVLLEAPEYLEENGGFCLIFNRLHGCMSVAYGAHDGGYLVFVYSESFSHGCIGSNKHWIQWLRVS